MACLETQRYSVFRIRLLISDFFLLQPPIFRSPTFMLFRLLFNPRSTLYQPRFKGHDLASIIHRSAHQFQSNNPRSRRWDFSRIRALENVDIPRRCREIL